MERGVGEKTVRRMAAHEKSGQLRNGAWFCKLGRPISYERVNKYEKMCHFMVRRFLPANALFEASMTYEDLVSQCRMEVFLALVDGFDPVKAMTSNIKDEKLRQAAVNKKLADPEKTLEKSEASIVYGRIENYLRRIRWTFHPDQFGGKTQSLDEIIEMSQKEVHYGCYLPPRLEKRGVFAQKEMLLDLIEKKGGEDRAKKAFEALAKENPELAELVVDSLRQA